MYETPITTQSVIKKFYDYASAFMTIAEILNAMKLHRIWRYEK